MTIDNVIAIIRQQMFDARHALSGWLHESDDVLGYRPKDGGWTGSQILEHVMLTSHYLLLIIDKASAKAKHRSMSKSIESDWENYKLEPEMLRDIGIHKSFPWVRPGHMEPTGNVFLNEIETTIMEQFDRCEAHLIHLKNGEGILCKTTMTVNSIGKLDVYQYIYFLILHAKRHLTQLETNKTEFQCRL
jgi:hypothetical protein